MKGGHIYLIHEREFMQTEQEVYKIGRTDNVARRFSQYPKGSRLLLSLYSHDVMTAERELIRIFRNIFKSRKDIGREYFEGTSQPMIDAITAYIRNETSHTNDTCKDEDMPTVPLKYDVSLVLMEYVEQYSEDLAGKTLRSKTIYNDFLNWVENKKCKLSVSHNKFTRELARLYGVTSLTHYFDDDDGTGVEHAIMFPYMLSKGSQDSGRMKFQNLLRRCKYTATRH